MLLNVTSALLVSSALPVAVLMCFIAMRYLGVDANIVALSGIAIAIGTMVDMGIVLSESMVQRMEEAPEGESLLTTIYEATSSVASAIITAVATTVISFLPVFTMEAAEGKLFKPLAYTKTFALVASIVVALTIIPPLAHTLFSIRIKRQGMRVALHAGLLLLGIGLSWLHPLAWLVSVIGAFGLLGAWTQARRADLLPTFGWLQSIAYALIISFLLTRVWMPLGVSRSLWVNFLFVSTIIGLLIGVFYALIHFYERILRFLLRFKFLFLAVVGLLMYQGYRVFEQTGAEFMPALNEGAFLLMPTAMPHAGMQENIKNLRLLDMAVTAIPEVETVVGKAGRVESALNPAPMSMYENVILYRSEYKTDSDGHRIRFAYDPATETYQRDEAGNLVPDPQGQICATVARPHPKPR
jgi:Cu(I)/Ag(I) efflux system membrane protein CusA/SilA